MRYYHTKVLLEQQTIALSQRITIAEAGGDTDLAGQLRVVRDDVADAVNGLDTLASPTTTDFRQRLYLERSDVKDRTNLLSVFLASTAFQSLQVKMQVLLQDQYKGMDAYLTALNARIALLEADATAAVPTVSQ